MQKAGAWWFLSGGDKIGQGKNNTIRHLEETSSRSFAKGIIEAIIREQLLTTGQARIVEDKDEEEFDLLDG